MPIYEYACQQCGHQFDTLQSLSEAPLTDCPVCHEPALTKLISAAGFRLKGGGWYETDFKSDKQRNLAGEKGDKPTNNGNKKADKKSDKTSKSDKPAVSKKEAKAKTG